MHTHEQRKLLRVCDRIQRVEERDVQKDPVAGILFMALYMEHGADHMIPQNGTIFLVLRSCGVAVELLRCPTPLFKTDSDQFRMCPHTNELLVRESSIGPAGA